MINKIQIREVNEYDTEQNKEFLRDKEDNKGNAVYSRGGGDG